jgi:cystathionine beta-lyase
MGVSARDAAGRPPTRGAGRRDSSAENLPEVGFTEPEGTYLAWLDFSALGLEDAELDRLIINRAGLWLDNGLMFGPESTGFQRMNLACPRRVVEDALRRLALIRA